MMWCIVCPTPDLFYWWCCHSRCLNQAVMLFKDKCSSRVGCDPGIIMYQRDLMPEKQEESSAPSCSLLGPGFNVKPRLALHCFPGVKDLSNNSLAHASWCLIGYILCPVTFRTISFFCPIFISIMAYVI